MLQYSKNLRDFKKNVGQLNHFLITIEVALKHVNAETKVPSDFHTTWEPQDWQQSVRRSEYWARKSALTYVCSAVEAYFQGIFNNPSLIQDSVLKRQYLTKVSNHPYNQPPSISWKMKNINNTYSITDYEKDLVCLMIIWRNGLVHQLKDYSDHSDYEDIKANLQKNKEQIYNNHSHLDIDLLLNRFENKKIPTFKETTSMIKATIDYVSIIDMNLLNSLDIKEYIDDLLTSYFNALKEKNIERYKTYFGFKADRQQKYLLKVLQENYGFDNDVGKNSDIIDCLKEIIDSGNTILR